MTVVAEPGHTHVFFKKCPISAQTDYFELLAPELTSTLPNLVTVLVKTGRGHAHDYIGAYVRYISWNFFDLFSLF